MRQEFHDTDVVVKVARRTARAIRNRFAARDFPVDLDDVEQDAAVAVLETIRRGTVDPRKNAAGYFYRAASRRAGLAASKMLSAVSFPDALVARAREWQVRIQIEGCGPAGDDEEILTIVAGALPDARIRRLQAARARLVANVRLRRRLARHLAQLPDRDRQAMELFLGFSGEVSGIREVIWRAQVSHQVVARSIQILTESVARDKVAQLARKTMRETDDVITIAEER